MTANPESRESAGAPPTLRALVLYLLRLGALGFGGPIALVGHMQRDLVESKKWVPREDYFEGLAFSQLCPGPLAAQLTEYIGWVHSGALGATLTGAAFVLPSFLMVLALASLYVHFEQLEWIQGLFYGIGAAVGAIAGAAVILSERALVDRTTVAIALVSFALLLVFKKIPEPFVILVAGVAGVAMHHGL
jgi:chromate transporter